MKTKKSYEKPFVVEVTIIQQTQLLQNVSVENWKRNEKVEDDYWGGDEPS